MKVTNLTSVVWKERKQYVSQCLDVDVASFGATKKKALENLQEALELYFEDQPLPKRGEIENPAIVSVSLEHA